MSDARTEGVVVDTMVISWLFDDRPNPLADRYRALIGARPVLLAFQTVMELRYGALRAGWGDLRRRRLERRVAELTVVQPDDEMITACAELRNRCRQLGHALGDKLHDGDRWIAAAALRLRVPVVSHDGVFDNVPGLELITAATRP
jgi:predicted nucleic acid-binding protein